MNEHKPQVLIRRSTTLEQCNACLKDMPLTIPHNTLRIRRMYFDLCDNCSRIIGLALIDALIDGRQTKKEFP